MNIHLVKHDKFGIGFALQPSNDLPTCVRTRWKVRFWRDIDREVFFPETCFRRGDLVDLGHVDDTEKNKLFS